jgi:hypothetical protein
MGQWLIADLSVADVHVQLWMLLVTGILLLWFLLKLMSATNEVASGHHLP